MSRIGRMPIAIPAGVTVTIAENNKVTVKGPKGTLERELPVEMDIKEEDGHIVVTRPNDLKKMKSLHGLTRTLINNMVVGVTAGYEKVLEVNGVGYRASKQGKKLTLNLGYSHPVEMEDPEGLETVLDGQNKITVKGIDKEKVGQYAAEIRSKRAPEPYKGKGIKYADETIRRKVRRWLVRNQEAKSALKSIPDYVIALQALQRDRVWLCSEVTTTCMLRLLTTQSAILWLQHPPQRRQQKLSWSTPMMWLQHPMLEL